MIRLLSNHISAKVAQSVQARIRKPHAALLALLRAPIFVQLTLFIAMMGFQPAAAEAACEAYSEDKALSRSLTVGSVQLYNRDVFNEKINAENQTIHRLANKLHIQSRKELIETQLLFSQGDPFDPDLLSETARNLRSNIYLRSATVTAKQICDGQVDILVETDDHWSLIPNFTFARAGGENEFAFRLAELNLLGLGKSLELGFDFTDERDQRILRYRDPMLFGSKTQFTTELQNNTDGEVQLVDFSKPFDSLDTRSSWRVRASNIEFNQNIYSNGSVVDQLSVDREFVSLEYGFSNGKEFIRRTADGRNLNRISRWRIGWRFDRTRLGATARFPNAEPVPERLFNYPFLQYTFLQPQYIEQKNLQLIESVEDIAIGHNLRTLIGFASEQFGSTNDSVVLEANYTKGWNPSAKWLGLVRAGFSGFAKSGSVENGIFRTTLEGFYFASRKNRFFASANIVVGNRLFEDRQIVLGGETGLRGYPLRFQTGTRRARFTVEQRYFLDWYPFRLARVGTAVFADIGAAWDDGEDPDFLKDIGFGLRILGTRQANAKVTHIDFAFPLDADGQIEQFQLVVSAKTQF